jgi:hypothetical protein
MCLAACTAIIGLRDDYTLAPDGGDDATASDARPDATAEGGWFVQSSWAGSVDGGAVTITLDSGMRAGDLVVVAVGWQNADASVSISDPTSNAYASAGTASAGSVYQQMFYLVVDAGGAAAINVTVNAPVQFLDVRMAEYAGPTTFTSYGVDVMPGQFYSVSVPGVSGEVLVAAGMSNRAIDNASDGGFAVRIETGYPFFNILQDRIADAAAANYTATATLDASGSAVFQLAAFK